MLVTLSIRNLAVVEEVDVVFHPGFHVNLRRKTCFGYAVR